MKYSSNSATDFKLSIATVMRFEPVSATWSTVGTRGQARRPTLRSAALSSSQFRQSFAVFARARVHVFWRERGK